MWCAHRDVLLGSIPARRLHPLGEERGLEAEGFHPGHPPALACRTHRRWLVLRWSRLWRQEGQAVWRSTAAGAALRHTPSFA